MASARSHPARPAGRKQPAYRFAAAVLKPPMMALASRDWPGAGPLARPGGVVVAVNHISHIDPLVVAHFLYDMDRPARFLAKSSLFETPVVGAVFRGAGQIEVHRESVGAADSLREAVAAVRAGECVVIYPEGTISRDRALWPMSGKTGAARIAFETGCPVVPMGVWGPQQLLGPYARRPRLRPRPTMRIRLGAPVPLDDLQPPPGTAPTGAVLATATDRIMDAITELVAGLRGQPAPAGRLDLHDESLARIGDAHVDYDWDAIAGGSPHDRRPA